MKQLTLFLISLFFTINTYAQQATAQLLFEEAETLYNQLDNLSGEELASNVDQITQKLKEITKIVGEKPKTSHLLALTTKKVFDMSKQNLYENEYGELVFSYLDAARKSAKLYMELKKNDDVDDRFRDMKKISDELQKYPTDKATWKKEKQKKDDLIKSEIIKKQKEIQQKIQDSKPEMILVEGGTFSMGSKKEKNEKPIHSVTLSSFSIGKYEITVGQYKVFCMATNRAMPKGQDEHPIVDVTYFDAIDYCNWLGEEFGGNWRLPTEAEWEYAARGGSKSAGYTYAGGNELKEVAWFKGNSEWQTQAVGRKKPNELGIYDMSGNVQEWCKDWYGAYTPEAQTDPKGPSSGTSRVLRGGSWIDAAAYCRVAYRSFGDPSYRNSFNGFRVVLSQ